MFDIISFGAATVDFFIKSKDFRVADDKLLLPYSSKAEVSDSLICSGGGATNSSVAFSRLGLKSACASLLGDDYLKPYILSDLTADHVDQSLLCHNRSESTDYSVILVAVDGGRTVLTNRGTTHLESKHINWDNIGDPSWFYITSLEGNIPLLEELIGYAHEHNIKVSLNPGNRELSQPRLLIPLLDHVDFLLLNKAESEMLTSISTEKKEAWDKLISFGTPIIAVTNGREGAHVLCSGQRLYSPIINTNPVDETGAGDSFGSAFVAALFHNYSPETALGWGITNSASVVSSLGAKTGLLTYEAIKSPQSLPQISIS